MGKRRAAVMTGVGRHVGPVKDGLVKVLLPFLEAVVHDGVAHQVRVIGLVTHQQINRLEDATADIFKYAADLAVRLYVAFSGCHYLANFFSLARTMRSLRASAASVTASSKVWA